MSEELIQPVVEQKPKKKKKKPFSDVSIKLDQLKLMIEEMKKLESEKDAYIR